MDIIMTGSSGYIGSHLSRYLEKQGHKIYGYTGEITEFDYIMGKFDMVIHLAALGSTCCAPPVRSTPGRAAHLV